MNLLNLNDLTEDQISEIFNMTDILKMKKHSKLLSEKTFVLFFPETSIRTRITFERGIKDLGGNCIVFPPESLDAREELQDRIQYLENWADGVVIRHSDYSKVLELSRYSSIPIINAMTTENHPCEVISDLYSIRSLKENYKDLVYTFVGPAGNISRSWSDISEIMDLKFNHVCSHGNVLKADNRNYKFHTELESVLIDSDVILTDSLPVELRTKEYFSKYQINLERLELTRKHSILNPCPPFFRNEEVTEEAISSNYFVGYEFKKNLLYVQQAIILSCCGINSSSIQ
ncbi:ornithine carbamoyltransferase [Paenibacillus sp. DS2015]|uniref:ornithine carbamoyltransferase n=1 Tax=Paenibacillus sp. DS2015 TaxID=3373917 RepID=UPI003D19D077